jgi:simple sugar transport system ATP-binding protein
MFASEGVCSLTINLLQHGEITFDKPAAETSVQELNDIVIEEYRQALEARHRAAG